MAADNNDDLEGKAAEGQQQGVTAGAVDGESKGTGEGTTAVDKGDKDAQKGSSTREESKQGQGKREEDDEEEELVIEQPLLTIKEVFVYQVPPLRASSGHRAEEWGLANPVFTGFLKAFQVGNACCLRLFKPPAEGELGAVPELFAECAVRLDNGRTLQVYVESVIDSSRYFVLRCEDQASGRHAYVGIGFRERSSAFDLKAVLDDFVRFLDRQKRAEETSAVAEEGDGEEALGPVKPMKDLSIAEGQKVHLGLKVGPNAGSSRARRRPRAGATASKPEGGGGGLLLAPPPLPGATYKGAAVASSGSGSGPIPPSSPPPGGPADGTMPSAVSPQAGEAEAADVVAPPAVASSASGQPPDEAPEEAEAGVGDSRGSGGGGGGGDGADDDGWGEFESA